MTAALVAVIAMALVFNYTNGFHDSSNAIAIAISTRAMPPRAALIMAVVMNVVGALLSTGVALTVANGIIDTPMGGWGLKVLFASLLGAVAWNLTTWYFGLPSSSSMSLIGGMVGAGLAAGIPVYWTSGVVGEVVLPTVISPVVGFVAAYLVMIGVFWLLRRANPHKVERGFRFAQIFSSAALALGHGLQDAQKSMGMILIALIVAGEHHGGHVPLWVVLACAAAMGIGTYSGGWRIMRTLGRKIFPLRPQHGFVAESVGSAVLYLTTFLVAAPISTTQVITSSVMGVGSTERVSAVRWGVAREIVIAWILTLPAAGIVAAIAYGLINLIF